MRDGPGTILNIARAELRYGDRTVWSGLDVRVQPGEFLVVLGPNGAGKSSLLRAVLGLVPLADGHIELFGQPPRRGDRRIGYVAQHRAPDDQVPLRGRDLVGMGVDGASWGMRLRRSTYRAAVDLALEQVGAGAYAEATIGSLSGGELQRLQVAQAIAASPKLILADEPLLSLDHAAQRSVVDLLETERRDHGSAVVFVTHDVNPVLRHADRILYLTDRAHALGPPDSILSSTSLSELYGAPIEVLRVRGRVLVVGAPEVGH
jgi:zinc/manganese transport system ATP-binding protein